MKDPIECRHELLQRVDKMARPPTWTGGAMRPFMVCSECGVVLFLCMGLNSKPETHRPWKDSEG